MTEVTRHPFYTDEPLQESVTLKITYISQRHAAQAARVLREPSGPNLSEWRVLMMLATYGPQTATALARTIYSDDSLISRTVKGMIANGLLQSSPEPKDRRATRLSLSQDVADLYERMRPSMHRRRVAVHEALSEEERNTLSALLAKLDRRMDEIDEDLQRFIE